jgi:hypothetical protein
LIAPKEWGHLLSFLSRSLPETHSLTREGVKIRFHVAKVYLVREYPGENGGTNTPTAGNGAIEILEKMAEAN